MTVSSTTTSVSYTGDGSTTAFPVSFAFFGTSTDAELIVIERLLSTGAETTLVNGTDYTVSGGSGSTGTVTATTAPASTKQWTIQRNTSRTQETDYVENDPFPAETHEAALDRLTMIGQEGYNLADRAFKFAASYTGGASAEVPAPSASTVLAWNSGATALENGPTTTEISNAQTYANNASASATTASNAASAASAAQTAAETAETNAEAAQAAAEAARDLAQGYAAAADVAKIEWQGAWQTSTAYAVNDAVSNGGSSYICIVAHTSGTFATDLAALKWELLAQKGADGTGSGDVSGPGSSTNGYVPQWSGTGGDTLSAGVMLDTDTTLAANSDTRIATQKAVKTYVDTATASAGKPAFKNLLIGGDFSTNPWQRGTAFNGVQASAQYTADRFSVYCATVGSGVFNVTQDADAPTAGQAGVGSSHSLKFTVGTAATGVGAGSLVEVHQPIEAYNFGHLGFGSASAKDVALSFWVKSSVTGTYSVFLQNYAQNRSYPSNFTVDAANTWELKTVVIPGDTTGTWPAGSSAGAAYLGFVLHCGSSFQGTNNTWNAAANYGTASDSNSLITTLGATFQMALVQLEPGSSATDFEVIPADTVLSRCQRYCVDVSSDRGTVIVGPGFNNTTTQASIQFLLPVPMRATPTLTQSGTNAVSIDIKATGTIVSSANASLATGSKQNAVNIYVPVAAGLTAGEACLGYVNGSGKYIRLEAEL